MKPYDRTKTEIVETPFGEQVIEYRLWDENKPDENWSFKQHIVPRMSEDELDSNGQLLRFFVEQYTIAKHLCENGFSSEVIDKTLLWTKYTNK